MRLTSTASVGGNTHKGVSTWSSNTTFQKLQRKDVQIARDPPVRFSLPEGARITWVPLYLSCFVSDESRAQHPERHQRQPAEADVRRAVWERSKLCQGILKIWVGWGENLKAENQKCNPRGFEKKYSSCNRGDKVQTQKIQVGWALRPSWTFFFTWIVFA